MAGAQNQRSLVQDRPGGTLSAEGFSMEEATGFGPTTAERLAEEQLGAGHYLDVDPRRRDARNTASRKRHVTPGHLIPAMRTPTFLIHNLWMCMRREKSFGCEGFRSKCSKMRSLCAASSTCSASRSGCAPRGIPWKLSITCPGRTSVAGSTPNHVERRPHVSQSCYRSRESIRGCGAANRRSRKGLGLGLFGELLIGAVRRVNSNTASRLRRDSRAGHHWVEATLKFGSWCSGNSSAWCARAFRYLTNLDERTA